MVENDFGFTSANLLKLGVYDDFYNTYLSIIDVYNNIWNEGNKNGIKPRSPGQWENFANKQVRACCEPLLKKYSFLFYNKPCTIYAGANSFSRFSFLNYYLTLDERDDPSDNHWFVAGYICVFQGFKSFAEFLWEIQKAVAVTISNWPVNKSANVKYSDTLSYIDINIQLLVDTGNLNIKQFKEGIKKLPTSRKELYHEFFGWLKESKKLDQEIDVLRFVYSIDRFLTLKSFKLDIWSIIKQRRFFLLFNCRQHPDYSRFFNYDQQREAALKLCFEFLGISFNSYIEYEVTKFLSERTNSKTLYLHKGNIACLRYSHQSSSIAASIAVDTGETVHVPATHCWKCNINFMNKDYYNYLKKKYRFIVANFCEIDDAGYPSLETGKMAAESPLKLCNYSVDKNSVLNDSERQQLLFDILQNGILTKSQILQYLSHFIDYNGRKSSNYRALQRWKMDYDFVAQLGIDEHPVVGIDEIRSYSRRNK